MTGPDVLAHRNAQNLADSSNGDNGTTENLALRVSLSLYEDSQSTGSHRLASGLIYLGENPTTPEEIRRVQNIRSINGFERYPDQPYFNKTFFLDDKTSQEIADSPLTKAALPFASVGYLTDRFDQITDNDRLTALQFESYAQSRQDAGPLEKAILSYLSQHMSELPNSSDGYPGLSRRELREIGVNLNELRSRSVADSEMKYLDKHFSDLAGPAVNSGLKISDLQRESANASDPEERQMFNSMIAKHSMLTRFDTADGATRNRGLGRLRMIFHENAAGITAKDIASWRSSSALRERLGVESKLDDNLKNFYETSKQQIKISPASGSGTFLDDIMK